MGRGRNRVSDSTHTDIERWHIRHIELQKGNCRAAPSRRARVKRCARWLAPVGISETFPERAPGGRKAALRGSPDPGARVLSAFYR